MKKWARSEKLELALRKQSNVDPDPIFAGIQQRTVDLAVLQIISYLYRKSRMPLADSDLVYRPCLVA